MGTRQFAIICLCLSSATLQNAKVHQLEAQHLHSPHQLPPSLSYPRPSRMVLSQILPTFLPVLYEGSERLVRGNHKGKCNRLCEASQSITSRSDSRLR
jgi:hypothetical protein